MLYALVPQGERFKEPDHGNNGIFSLPEMAALPYMLRAAYTRDAINTGSQG